MKHELFFLFYCILLLNCFFFCLNISFIVCIFLLDKGTFYIDTCLSFTQMFLYGNEMHIFVLEFLLLLAVYLMFTNVFAAVVVVCIFNKVKLCQKLCNNFFNNIFKRFFFRVSKHSIGMLLERIYPIRL